MFSPVQSCSVLFSPVQSCSVFFSPVQSCSVLVNSVQSCSVLLCPVQSQRSLFRTVYPVLFLLVELELFEVVFISGGLTEPEVLVAVALGRVPEPDALFGRRFSELPTLDPNPGRLPEPVLGVFRSCLGVWIAKSPSLDRELSKGVFVPRPGR